MLYLWLIGTGMLEDEGVRDLKWMVGQVRNRHCYIWLKTVVNKACDKGKMVLFKSTSRCSHSAILPVDEPREGNGEGRRRRSSAKSQGLRPAIFEIEMKKEGERKGKMGKKRRH